jgi:hypothetical protein
MPNWVSAGDDGFPIVGIRQPESPKGLMQVTEHLALAPSLAGRPQTPLAGFSEHDIDLIPLRGAQLKADPWLAERMAIAGRLAQSGISDDLRLSDFLAVSAGCALYIAAKRGECWTNVTDEGLRHVRDWLRAAIAADEPWISRIDEHGTPLRLFTLMTMEDCLREPDGGLDLPLPDATRCRR